MTSSAGHPGADACAHVIALVVDGYLICGRVRPMDCWTSVQIGLKEAGPHMRINQNIPAMFAYRALMGNENGVAKATERLSSGLRINRAADDAAGLAISENMRGQVNGLNQAQRNAGDGISLLQTAEGGLNETHAILQRMRTLAVQAANGVNSADNLRAIQAEMTELTAEIDRIAYGSEFNGMDLLDGSFYKKNLQVGANAGDTMEVSIYSSITPARDEITIPPTEAGIALWDVDQHLASLPNPVVVHQEGATPTEVSVDLNPAPATVRELVDLLNADPNFSAAFTATTGSYRKSDLIPHTDVNLIIESKTPGYGEVKIPDIGHSTRQYRTGSNEVVHPAQEERIGGFGSIDILGPDPIDVTRQAGSVTIPGGKYEVGGQTIGFGNGDFREMQTIEFPDRTQSWPSGAGDAIGRIDRAIEIVSRGRADMGAAHNRLEHTINSVGVSAENLAMSESRIRDADMAKEISTLQQRQILSQAAMEMLKQAQQVPQTVLKLIQ